SQIEPLSAEVFDQGGSLGVLQHPLDLSLANRAVAKHALFGQAEQLFVRHRTPQEIRKPRGNFPIVEHIAAVRAVRRSVRLDAEQEMWRHQSGLQANADGAIKVLALPAGQVDESHEAI